MIDAPDSHLSPPVNNVTRVLAGVRVLIVDDDRVARTVNSRGLSLASSKGLSSVPMIVTTAEDGQEAVRLLLDRSSPLSVDIVFMDLMMPKMNGYEATRILRKEGILVPIIAMTGDTFAREDYLEVGMSGIIIRPFEIRDLCSIVERFVLVTSVDGPYAESAHCRAKNVNHKHDRCSVNFSSCLCNNYRDMSIYRDALELFVDDYEVNFLSDVLESIKENRNDAQYLLHQFNSAASSICAENLQQIITELCEISQKRQLVENDLDRLQNEMKCVFMDISVWLSEACNR